MLIILAMFSLVSELLVQLPLTHLYYRRACPAWCQSKDFLNTVNITVGSGVLQKDIDKKMKYCFRQRFAWSWRKEIILTILIEGGTSTVRKELNDVKIGLQFASMHSYLAGSVNFLMRWATLKRRECFLKTLVGGDISAYTYLRVVPTYKYIIL